MTHPPMTPRHRVFLAVTVLSFLTVTGVVIGCDSDDTPTVTAPSGGSGSGTPTRNMTAEQQGRDGLEETDNGRMIRNTGDVALNVRFNYDEPRHYRLNADTAMPSNPANADSAPTRVACGVPATGRANGQCFDNDGEPAPEPYRSSPGGGQPNPGTTPPNAQTNSNGWDAEWALHCLSETGKGTDNHMVTNSCTGINQAISVTAGCPAAWYEPHVSLGGLTTYDVNKYPERPAQSGPIIFGIPLYSQFKDAKSVNTHWLSGISSTEHKYFFLGSGQSANVRGDLCKRQAESDEPQGPGMQVFRSKAVALIACFANRRITAGEEHSYAPYFLNEVQSEINDTASYRWGCYDQVRG